MGIKNDSFLLSDNGYHYKFKSDRPPQTVKNNISNNISLNISYYIHTTICYYCFSYNYNNYFFILLYVLKINVLFHIKL